MATINIYPENYKHIYDLMESILQANGGINRIERPRKCFLLTFDSALVLNNADVSLAQLSVNDRLTLADGEKSERHALCETSPWLSELNRYLNHWFEQGMP